MRKIYVFLLALGATSAPLLATQTFRVPEPASAALVGLGLAGLALWRRAGK